MPSAKDPKEKGMLPSRSLAARSSDAIRVSAKDGKSYAEILKALKVKVNPRIQERRSTLSREPGGSRSSWSSKKGVTSQPSRRRSNRRSGRRPKLNLWSQRGPLKLGTSTRPSQGRGCCRAMNRTGQDRPRDQCRLYKRFGAVQTAVVRLTEADTRSLLGVGRLMAGWVNCRI